MGSAPATPRHKASSGRKLDLLHLVEIYTLDDGLCRWFRRFIGLLGQLPGAVAQAVKGKRPCRPQFKAACRRVRLSPSRGRSKAHGRETGDKFTSGKQGHASGSKAEPAIGGKGGKVGAEPSPHRTANSPHPIHDFAVMFAHLQALRIWEGLGVHGSRRFSFARRDDPRQCAAPQFHLNAGAALDLLDIAASCRRRIRLVNGGNAAGTGQARDGQQASCLTSLSGDGFFSSWLSFQPPARSSSSFRSCASTALMSWKRCSWSCSRSCSAG